MHHDITFYMAKPTLFLEDVNRRQACRKILRKAVSTAGKFQHVELSMQVKYKCQICLGILRDSILNNFHRY